MVVLVMIMTLLLQISRFGVPSQVTTDRGPQFGSGLFKGLTDILGTTRVRTTSYHPASNGLVERLHRHLKAALVAHEDRAHWVHHLPLVLLGIRAAVKTDIGCSAADLVYGCALRLPADFFVPPSPDPSPSLYLDRLHRFFATLRPVATRASSTRRAHVPQDLSSATHVFLRTDAVRKSLTPPYSGPHPVLGRHGKNLRISINGREDVVAVDRLKPAYIDHATVDSYTTDSSAWNGFPPTLGVPASANSSPNCPKRIEKHVTWADSCKLPLVGGHVAADGNGRRAPPWTFRHDAYLAHDFH
ncbi:uncharacterized protein LOC135372488 [Ornithodoros turicata]|uniref:uncharacterized protein LOC135372488 n=1 Tax=Ornithodoros turicata TaxID=34597 RepID=UPI00313A0719